MKKANKFLLLSGILIAASLASCRPTPAFSSDSVQSSSSVEEERTSVPKNEVYVSHIFLLNQTLKNPADPSKDIYRVLEKHSYLEEHPGEEDTFLLSRDENLWADYLIQIMDYNYLCDYLGNSLKLEAKVLPDEATNKTLNFNGRKKDEVYATVSNDGEVKYQTKLEEVAVIAVHIAATDGSGIACNVKIQSRMYI